MASRDTTELSDVSKMKSEVDGSFKRVTSTFRSVIEAGGQFTPEKDRYHLYVSYACPWATRTLIVRKLKGLEQIIPLTVVSPRLGEHGWPFGNVDEFPGAEADPLYNSNYINDLYLRADPRICVPVRPARPAKFTVPVLWDKKLNTVVNNESSEIIRMFNSAFNDMLPTDKAALDLYPEPLRAEIDALNDWVYSDINSSLTWGCFILLTYDLQTAFIMRGFATQQAVYEKAVVKLFEGLDKVEQILTGKDYLVGGQLSEADVRLFVTVIRFDPAYVGHFKCNIRTIRDGYPAIHSWLRKLYWTIPAFKDSTFFDHIKGGYYESHPNPTDDMAQINPTRIIPVGPLPHIMPL
ncbi:Glutathione S-transferase omega-like 2 [Mycena venus]|uniref:Glutathione S-transferase omega-like 2 n=1 Tax=Mycena venus TaxID=2733690 RepID=A0A8H6YVL9_9AGAR|nr:Glutathione S-transferase omega-like 2 [Mycena venus]